MALAFSDLQDKVLAWLDEGTHATADATTLARVKEAIVEADVLRASERWPFMVQEPPKTFTFPVDGTSTVTLDPTLHIPIYFWNVTKKESLIQHIEENVPSRDLTANGILDEYLITGPQYGKFLLRGQQLKLLWLPTSADTIEYGFYKLPIEMSADTDLPNIPYPYSRVLIFDALLRMMAYNEDIAAAKVQLWSDGQTKWETRLFETYGRPNNDTIAGESIRWIPRP